MASRLEQVPWGELFHQSDPVVPATDVPIILRALAVHGPKTDLKVPRSVASHLTGSMCISPVTPLPGSANRWAMPSS